MANNKTYNLILRYINKTISDEEIVDLKKIVNVMDDDELYPYLFNAWNEFYKADPQNDEIIKEIKSNIDKICPRPSKRKYYLFNYSRIASILLIPVIAISAYLIISGTFQSKPSYINPTIVETGKGQQTKIIMPDGTKIDLNSESTLLYSPIFNPDNRTVTLTGEGFFDVTKDEKGKNFVVHTEFVDIEVLGTKFDVNTQSHTFNCNEKSDDFVEIALLTGSIKALVKGDINRDFAITPNQKLIFNKQTGEVNITAFDAYKETAWTRNLLIFRSSPLKDVLLNLERKFGMQIIMNDRKLENDLFSGTIRANTITEVMDILSTHYRFSYTITNDTIMIKISGR